MSLASGSAPAINRVCITAKWPLIQAICKDVLKFLVLASIKAPYSIKISTRLVWPSLAATWSGAHPSVLVQFILSYT